MANTTIVIQTGIVTNANGISVPNGPAVWVDAFQRNGVLYWVAGVGTDAVTFLDLTPGQSPTRTFIGTATQGGFDAFKAFHGSNCFDGEEAAQNGQLLGFLRSQTKSNGTRLVPTLRLEGQSLDISVISPHVVSGHDRIEAALPSGVSEDDVEVDETIDPP